MKFTQSQSQTQSSDGVCVDTQQRMIIVPVDTIDNLKYLPWIYWVLVINSIILSTRFLFEGWSS